MLENIVSNLKTSSVRLTESLSVENFKLKTIKFSETLDNIRESVLNKTNSLSSYLSEGSHKEGPTKTISSPNLNVYCGSQTGTYPIISDSQSKLDLEPLHDYEFYDYNDDSDEPDIVDKFSRVVNLSDEVYEYDPNYRRNDREEIRRRLATGTDNDDYYGGERSGRKPSLQARLQSGMNLQICFMNETMSDTESPCSEAEPPVSLPAQAKPKVKSVEPPRSLNIISKPTTQQTAESQAKNDGTFFERQARLQAEARVALAQAKDLARMQMQAERQRHQTSPITEMLRASLHKVGIPFPEGRRRVSRQMLTDMNVAQLQVIVNDLHTQIELLNEGLVKYLMERDELHMGQDSMLVDIEDLTRYLGAKENLIKEDISHNNNLAQVKPPMITRIVNLGKK